MENKKLCFFSWVPVIAVIMIVVGWFLTPDSTSQLKTYNTNNIGISFEYPGDWNMANTDMGVNRVLEMGNPNVFVVVDTLKNYMLGVMRGHSDYNKKIRYNKPLKYADYNENMSEEIEINEKPAYKFSFNYTHYTDSVNTRPMQACEVLIPLEEKVVLIGFHAPEDKFEDSKANFASIMKSISIKN